MMRYILRLYLLLIVALLAGMLPMAPRPVMAQQPPQTQPVGFPCYSGANPPPDVLCLAVPVQDSNRKPVRNAKVTATFAGHSRTRLSEQLADLPVDSAVAALDVGALGARPGDLIALHVESGQLREDRLVGLTPDPASRTHFMEPVRLGAPRELGHRPIWGTVFTIDDRVPLRDAKVQLFLDKKLLRETTTAPTVSVTPTFELDPGNIPLNSTLRLEVTYNDQRATVQIPWHGMSVNVPVVLNWQCIYENPYGGSGGTGDMPYGGSGGTGDLPDSFCLTGQVLLDNQPVSGAQVSIEVLDRSPELSTTRIITGSDQPMFAVNIGRLVDNLPPTTEVRITATYDNRVGTLSTTREALGVNRDWGTSVTIPLRGERMSAPGLAGGTPGPLAMVGTTNPPSIYAGLPAGGGIVGQMGPEGAWLRLFGSADHPLPTPDVTALHGFGLPNGEDLLLAGTRGGELFRSTDSGRSWVKINLSQPIGPIVGLALARARNETLYVAGQGGLLAIDSFVGPSWAGAPRQTLIALPFTPTALATASDGQLLVGTTSGLQASRDGGFAWKMLRPGAVTAVTAAETGFVGAVIFVGTPQGLFSSDFRGQGWTQVDLQQPILGLAASASGQFVGATTPAGIFQLDRSGRTWLQVTTADTLSSSDLPTVGAPDVFDFAQFPNGKIIAATRTGLYLSDDGGMNWHPFSDNSLPRGGSGDTDSLLDPARSVAPLPNGEVLALSGQRLVRWTQQGQTVVSGLPTDMLNGAVVRASQDGRYILVGRGAGPGASLYASQDYGATWQALKVGFGRGITAIAFFNRPQNGVTAVITTEGDGVFGWSPGSPSLVTPYPSLVIGGRQARTSAVLLVEKRDECEILVGVSVVPAATVSRPCDQIANWEAPQQVDHTNVSSVQALVTIPGGRIFAATNAGIFQGNSTGGWSAIFGMPLRPLALAIPASYGDDRLLLAGGPQSGVVLLSDVAPDLVVSLEGPATAVGEEELTYIARLSNQGLLPVEPGTATWNVDSSYMEPLTPATFSFDTLRTSQEISFTIKVRVKRDAHPARATLRLTVPPFSGERFPSNNSDEVVTLLDYRDGPDPAVILGGATMLTISDTGRLRLRVVNLGNQQSDPGQIQHTLPPTVTLVSSTPGAQLLVGNVLRWPVKALQPREAQDFLVEYRLDSNMPSTAVLTVEAKLSPPTDDREPNNNTATAALRLAPHTPQLVAVTNWTRLARFGPPDAARARLNEYLRLPEVQGIEIALDAGQPCQGSGGTSLACRYQDFDTAVDELAEAIKEKRLDESADLAEDAIAKRALLVQSIKAAIQGAIAPLPSKPRYLYLIGGDAVIPSAAEKDEVVQSQSNNREEEHARWLNPTDALYSTLLGNYYPTYQPYQQIGATAGEFIVAVQPGRPEEIAKVLETYTANHGQIQIQHGNVAGTAEYLTEDLQHQICEDLRQANLPVTTDADDCTKISPSVAGSTADLEQGNRVVSWSGHSDQYIIGDLKSTMLNATNMPLVNLLLLLGCHTGLAPAPDLLRAPSLASALAAKGQPAFGYLGYAYAATYEGKNSTSIAYAEQLQQLLVQRIMRTGLTLGEIYRGAIKDYSGATIRDTTPLRAKTIRTLALYGPPTYRVIGPGLSLSNNALMANTAGSTGVALTQSNGATTLDLRTTYSAVTTSEGTRYLAQTNIGTPIEQIEMGHTVQPGGRIALPANAAAVLIRGGQWHDLAGTDPIIPRVAPLQSGWQYSEPEYLGPPVDRANPVAIYRDGDNVPQLLITLGQWFRAGQVQRLFDTLSLEVITAREGTTPTPPRPGTVTFSCPEDGKVRISMPAGGDVARAEVVLFEAGALRVVPMNLAYGVWTAIVDVRAETQFLIQSVSPSRGGVYDTNHEQLYTIAAPGAPCTVISNFPATGVLDDFNRANGKLGKSWSGSEGLGGYQIIDRQVDVLGGGPIYWQRHFGPNQEAFITLTQVDRSGDEQDLLLKVQGKDPGWRGGGIEVLYDARANGGAGALRVETFRPGKSNWTLYPNIPITLRAGDQLGGRVLADGTVWIYRNRVLIAIITLNQEDQKFFNHRGGFIGLWFIDAGAATLDDFGGGTIMP